MRCGMAFGFVWACLIMYKLSFSQAASFVTRRVNTGSLSNLANKLAQRFTEIKCNVMKAGIGCDTPGLQQRWEDLAPLIYSTEGILFFKFHGSWLT